MAGLILLSACAAPAPSPLRLRALELLRREEARDPDPTTWDALLRDPEPALRQRAARALGRTRLPGLLAPALGALGREPDPAVRDELLWALGMLGEPRARGPLLDALSGQANPALRARAAEALGRLGPDPAVLEGLLAQLAPATDPRLLGAALLALARLHGQRALAAGADPLPPASAELLRERLTPLLEHEHPDVRWRAVYALSELDLPGAAPLLLRALAARPGALDAAPRDRGVVARLFAARGLARCARQGALPDPSPLRGQLAAAADPHLAAALAGLLGAAAGPAPASDGASAAAVDTRAWLLEELIEAAGRARGPADHHLRAAALVALREASLPAPPPPEGAPPPVPLPERVERALRARLEDESPTVRGEALLALTRCQPEGARADVERAAGRSDPLDRAAGARAAAALPALSAAPLLQRLARDEDPRVAAAALRGLGRRESGPRLRAAAREALLHRDLAVRLVALELLARLGGLEDAGAVFSAALAARTPEQLQERLAATRVAGALLARARLGRTAASLLGPHPGEVLARALLERGLLDAPGVASRAADALQELSGRRPPLRPVPRLVSPLELEPGVDLLRADPTPLLVELETTRGRLLLELDPEAAPRHVKSFCALARRGFYDGLGLHRVVTGFLVQGLDPRGDGLGTGGVWLADEPGPAPFEAGALGAPGAGPAGGGCQVFLTHVPTPHLDGLHTAFGRIRAGMDVLDALDLGDRVRRVRILESGAPVGEE